MSSTFDCWANSHPPITPQKYSKPFNPWWKRKGEKNERKKNKGVYFKFRPTVHLRLAAFPHAPDRHNPSTTPSSPASSGEPSPSANGKDHLTSCLPLTLSIPRPHPLAGLQTDRPLRPDANSENTWQSEHTRHTDREGDRERDRVRHREGEIVHGCWGRWSEKVCEWDSLSPLGHWSSRFTRGVCEWAQCASEQRVVVGWGPRRCMVSGFTADYGIACPVWSTDWLGVI